MVEVYYYIPVGDMDDVVDCGLKLSRWFDKEVSLSGEVKKCLSALLNPKDDAEKYGCTALKCVKLQVQSNYCFVADRYLYEVGLDNPRVMQMYLNTVIPVEKYIFGTYRLPECLVTSTVVGGYISVLNKGLDSPVLVDNSESLYINNIIEDYKEKYDDFYDAALYCFYNKLAEIRKVDKIEDRKRNIAVFLDKDSNKTITVKIPDISRY